MAKEGKARKGAQRVAQDMAEGQKDFFEKSYEEELEERKKKPVECMGMTFENDDARRRHFLDRLAKKLKEPAFRKIEGFPIGTDEDILALSDPPYHTACPNPFLADFVKVYGKPYEAKSRYRREPFAADVSEGKNDPLYDAHSYHTKVPHKAVMRYILHYTQPGDLVLDGFCGTGMTGVASQLCGDAEAIRALGYGLRKDGSIVDSSGDVISSRGSRNAILCDLSPAAAFIARNILSLPQAQVLQAEASRVLERTKAKYSWAYHTSHGKRGQTPGDIIYCVWSDHFICDSCHSEMTAWDVVLDRKHSVMTGSFHCPGCGALLQRRNVEKAMETTLDPVIGKSWRHTKQSLAQIYYMTATGRFEKAPDKDDLAVLTRCVKELRGIPVPVVDFQHTSRHTQDGNHLRGILKAHHYYTPRNLMVLAALKEEALRSNFPHAMLFVLTGFMEGHANRRNRYILDRHHPSGTTCGPLTNTLFVPELQCEVNLFRVWDKTVHKQAKAADLRMPRTSIVEVASSTSIRLPDSSVDYVFVDPPFGKNILYSDLNLLWEAWLGVRTNTTAESIINETQGKDLPEYGALIARSVAEFYRVLKPGRWITLEFHNSLNSVWVAIQEALQNAGFVVADVRVLDKQHGTIHQDSGYTVKQDLIVSAYKPSSALEEKVRLQSGAAETAWDFTRAHLGQLPVFVKTQGHAEIVSERQGYLLYDRMVAFHVQRGLAVPLSAAEYHAGLVQRFPEREGMYFLPDQIAEYDKKRARVEGALQMELFVTDEASAVQWLRRQLEQKPQTFPDIHPAFMREIAGWEKHERPLELKELLAQNFLCYDGEGEVPPQIHAYLSTNHKDCRKLAKTAPVLRLHAKDRWYVPDPKKAGDLERIRERALLKEFWEYLPPGYKPQAKSDSQKDLPGLAVASVKAASGKRIPVLRMEAVRAGFRYCWQNRDYRTIAAIARRIPQDVLQEDAKLLMWYDQALTRLGEE